MKKTYQSPVLNIVKVVSTNQLLNASPGGVQTGGTPGDEYTSTDKNYSRQSFNVWGDDDED